MHKPSLPGRALATALLFASLAVAQKTALKPDDLAASAATPNKPSWFLGPLGVQVKIQSASVASDGTITTRFTLKDGNGVQPLDRLGAFSAGPVSLSFIAAYIPAGQTQYVAYTTTTLAATINNNPSQIQAGTDTGGIYVQNDIGDYTYTFGTKAPKGFDATATHTIGVTATRNLSAFGTFDTARQAGNDVFTFVPNGAAVTVTRSVVTTATCNSCHDPLIGHGGSRISTDVCILCHTPQTTNPDTQLSMNFPVLIHKIHKGSSLPSVIAGTPYRIWHRGAWSDFSTVVFPQDTRNCTKCHVSGPAQADAWKTNPNRAACGSCHDNVDFVTGKNHVNLPQPDDTQCKSCHAIPQVTDFDASITGAHVVPANSATLPGVVLKVVSVANTTPGMQPQVTFSVMDKKGNPYDISKLTTIRVVLGGPNSDYNTGPGAIRVSEDPSKTAGSGGVYTYTMTNKVPAAANGSYTVSLEAANNVTLLPGTPKQTVAVDSATPVEYYFSVDSSATMPRRQVVANANCNACHQALTFIHGGTRGSVTECVVCHNPALVDGTSKQPVNFAGQIHSIHRGTNLANPYVIGGTNFQSLRFPGDLRVCTTCHLAGTYQVNNVGGVATVASPGDFLTTMPQTTAACLGCHDSVAAASHAQANTTKLGEACVDCHGVGKQFAVDTVHAAK